MIAPAGAVLLEGIVFRCEFPAVSVEELAPKLEKIKVMALVDGREIAEALLLSLSWWSSEGGRLAFYFEVNYKIREGQDITARFDTAELAGTTWPGDIEIQAELRIMGGLYIDDSAPDAETRKPADPDCVDCQGSGRVVLEGALSEMAADCACTFQETAGRPS